MVAEAVPELASLPDLMRASTPRPPWRGLLLLWLAALLVDLWGIQQGPLRDWDESLVARVALELSEKPWPQVLLPSFWGVPYENKPPGAHWLIAASIQLWRSARMVPAAALPPEWLVRLAPALGSSLLSPLLGLVQWQLRPGLRADALWTAAVALTLLPLARHAHLAMLDGLQLTAMAALWLGLLRARGETPLLPGLLAGLAASGLLLLKAPVALPVLAVSLLLRWAERDLDGRAWRWLLLGIALGLAPGLTWHGWHLAWRGDSALVMWGRQGLARVVSSVENHAGGPIPPLIQVLIGGWPWLLLWPTGITMAWRERRSRWGRWCLGLTGLASLLVLPLQTQLPWYSLVLWPPFCLCCGPALAQLVQGRLSQTLQQGIARIWLTIGILLLAVLPLRGLSASLATAAGLTLPAGAALLGAGVVLGGSQRPRSQRSLAAWGLVLGWCLSLLLLFSSTVWNWELNQTPAIAPLLPLVSRASRPGELGSLPLLVEEGMHKRPSLRWYAQEALPEPLQAIHSSKALLLVSRAESPERSALAGNLGIGGIHGRSCRLDRRGSQGWNRWLCGPAGADPRLSDVVPDSP